MADVGKSAFGLRSSPGIRPASCFGVPDAALMRLRTMLRPQSREGGIWSTEFGPPSHASVEVYEAWPVSNLAAPYVSGRGVVWDSGMTGELAQLPAGPAELRSVPRSDLIYDRRLLLGPESLPGLAARRPSRAWG